MFQDQQPAGDQRYARRLKSLLMLVAAVIALFAFIGGLASTQPTSAQGDPASTPGIEDVSPPPPGSTARPIGETTIDVPDESSEPTSTPVDEGDSSDPDILITDDAIEAETHDLYIYLWSCPPGYDMNAAGAVPTSDCTTPADGVSFTINGYLTFATATTAGGEVTLSGLAPGNYAVDQAVPGGIASTFWECVRLGEPAGATSGPHSEGSRLNLGIESGFDYRCDWFNVPTIGDDGDSTGTTGDDDGTGTVRLSKYTCPEGVERSEDDYVLSEQCSEEVEPVQFTITGGDYNVTASASVGVPQELVFVDVPFRPIGISEVVPAGYGEPLVFCSDTPADGAGNYEPVGVHGGNTILREHRADADIPLSCLFFNFPEDDGSDGNTVTVNKHVCPSWANPETETLLDVCTPGGDGIAFELVDGNGRYPAAVTGGRVEWTDVIIAPVGEMQIIESIPVGYSDPLVVCDGIRVASTNGFVLPESGEERPFHIACDWFNFPLEPSSLRVVKHTCEPGYDLHGAGADPLADCPVLATGVTFRLTGPGVDITTIDRDVSDGSFGFGELDPGGYTLVETVPEGATSSFVLDCYGNNVGAVRPYPLSSGDTLNLTVHAGEEITCHWFNVLEANHGELTVSKYICASETFASEVDCQVYEDGATFDLVRWNGDPAVWAWEYAGTSTTNGHGLASYGPLEPGDYWLDEHDGDWCHLASDRLDESVDGNGRWLNVEVGQETSVKVYNCGAEPGSVGETPTKYPDTGVPPPDGGTSAPIQHPASTALAGALLTRRRLLAFAAMLPAAGALLATRALAQNDQVIVPIDGTPVDVTPEPSLCLAATQTATDDEECRRGPIPATLRIEAIGVDAPVEVLETVAGVMQQPSDEVHVAWYKETARLGEAGNILIAGHLNWWNVPEAVFYYLAELEEGARVELTAEEGATYVYHIQWVRQESNLEPPDPDVLGSTDVPSLTLITCGGEWDASISEYDERTVARAVQIEVIAA